MKFLFVWSPTKQEWVFCHGAELVNGHKPYHEMVRAQFRARRIPTKVVTFTPPYPIHTTARQRASVN